MTKYCNEYIFTEHFLKRYQKLKRETICHICEQQIEIGQEVITKQGRRRRKLYHRSCAVEKHILLTW